MTGSPVFGGSIGAVGSAEDGYVSHRERELELYMECLWDLFGSISSLYEGGRTVPNETHECNKNCEIDSKHSLCRNTIPNEKKISKQRNRMQYAHLPDSLPDRWALRFFQKTVVKKQ